MQLRTYRAFQIVSCVYAGVGVLGGGGSMSVRGGCLSGEADLWC